MNKQQTDTTVALTVEAAEEGRLTDNINEQRQGRILNTIIQSTSHSGTNYPVGKPLEVKKTILIVYSILLEKNLFNNFY